MRSEMDGHYFLRPSRLLRFFTELPQGERERLGIEYVSLGIKPESWLKEIREQELGVATSTTVFVSVLGGTGGSALFMTGDLLLKIFGAL
jgi:hypothetical protein